MIFRSCCCNPKTAFTGGPSKEFSEITQRSLVYGNNPRKNEINAMWPSGGLDLPGGEIGGRRRPDLAGGAALDGN
jgi:hypothetical protein